MVANMPACHMKQRVQNGSAATGPAGQLARLAEMLAKKAGERPAPLVRAIGVGIEDGMIQPARARPRTTGLSSYSTPSEISNSMRTAARTGVTGAATRAPRKVETATARDEQRNEVLAARIPGAAAGTNAIVGDR
jgi:hypothetical protein